MDELNDVALLRVEAVSSMSLALDRAKARLAKIQRQHEKLLRKIASELLDLRGAIADSLSCPGKKYRRPPPKKPEGLKNTPRKLPRGFQMK